MDFYSGEYRKIELFIRNKGRNTGFFQISSAGETVYQCRVLSDRFRKIAVDISPRTEYHVDSEQAEISQMYLCGNENICETGVEHLIVNNEAVEEISKEGLLDTPYREQYHFAPFVNWSNDPNGLCWFRGYYHLFYQCNPHEQIWGNMYWGHAVSKDLVHWKYLPFALEPQQEVLLSSGLAGGAFSGSAVACEDGIRVFFTRDIEKIGDYSTIRQSQATAFSKDGLTFSDEKELLPAFSLKGADHNFRDPRVVELDGKWYMLIASNYQGKGSVLLYVSEDMEHWEFLKPLLQMEQKEIPSLECPDFFRLGDETILLISVMGYRTEYGVYQPVLYYIGDWTDNTFAVRQEGVCDFGGNFYAAQTLEHDGRRILFGWVCDFFKEHEIVRHGVYGSFSLPRELSVRGSGLYQKPVKEVYDLLGDVCLRQEGGRASEVRIPGNSYYGCIDFDRGTGFEVVLFDDGCDYLKLIGNERQIELLSSRNKDKNARYVADIRALNRIEIFMDRRVVEIYVNDGEKAGTKIFINHTKAGYFRTCFEDESAVKQILVRQMEAIWKS